MRRQTSGSWSRTQTSFGAVNPVRASLPVISIRRSGPTAAADRRRIRRPVRWSFQRIAGRRTSSARIEQDEAVHLAGQPDRHDLGRRDAGRRQDRADRVDAAVPPQPRVLLAPQRPRDVEPVLRHPDPADGPRLVDEDGLRRGRRDVDPEDEAHPGQRLEPDSTPAPSAAQIAG